MRAVPVAIAILALSAGATRAEDMIAGKDGLMCRTEMALADLTTPSGSAKPSVHQDISSSEGKDSIANCRDLSGETVHVVTKRRNTSIVTLNGETWYVANINFFRPSAKCLREGAAVTVTGVIERRYYDPDNGATKPYYYSQMKLDKPVCYVADRQSTMAADIVSLVGTSRGANAALLKTVGKHVTVSGTVESPQSGNSPPDPMMINDPVIRPGS